MKCEDCPFRSQIDWGSFICLKYDELGLLDREELNKECKGKRLGLKPNNRKPNKKKSIVDESWGML